MAIEVWNDAKGFFYCRSHVLPLGMPLKKIACASNKISFISTPSMAGFTLPPVNRRLPVIFPDTATERDAVTGPVNGVFRFKIQKYKSQIFFKKTVTATVKTVR